MNCSVVANDIPVSVDLPGVTWVQVTLSLADRHGFNLCASEYPTALAGIGISVFVLITLDCYLNSAQPIRTEICR
ncbi:hypothetical protein PILCRDRAFT_511735 [Piloderma croceum F 1598]|uniref:Uncharacterized protein n=1 Tax=Piloderma croceum (strain F 1598) TaxID=765440 RepID=A0A0C3FMR0_PILCF|nr:hypothetical protein PILCRDRAFT_511735 [Piloderma croceum F 1598]